MPIHHATQKKANDNAIHLTELEDGNVEAHWVELNRKLVHPDPKVALALMMLQRRFGLEYNNIIVVTDGVTAATMANETDLMGFDPTDFDESEVYADSLERMVEEGIEPEAAEEETFGNIVPRRYREAYSAAGHPNTCGDWLANILNAECTATNEQTGKEFFDISRFDEIYDENKGPRNQKWCNNTSSRGWQGRYRMSGRIALAKVVAINGYMKLDGEKIEPPKQWLEAHRPKKKAKSQKAA